MWTIYEVVGAGQLLYVGITQDLRRRRREHKEYTFSGRRIAVRALCCARTESDARDAERQIIQGRKPTMNIAHGPSRSQTVVEWVRPSSGRLVTVRLRPGQMPPDEAYAIWRSGAGIKAALARMPGWSISTAYAVLGKCMGKDEDAPRIVGLDDLTYPQIVIRHFGKSGRAKLRRTKG